MQYESCLMSTVISVWDCCLLMPSMNLNSENRVTALWIARVMWPHCSRFLFITYHGYACLLLHDENKGLLSREGITQGSPLSMMLYVVAVLSLIHFFKDPDKWTQDWCANYSSCVADLSSLQT